MHTTPLPGRGRRQLNLSQNSRYDSEQNTNMLTDPYAARNVQGQLPRLAWCRAQRRSHRAESLYEAVAQALRVFRENDWREDTERDPAAVIVNVRQPEMEHRVRIRDFENWLDSAGKSPAEMALKGRLRAMLER
jgi:hypothetical protein